MEPRYLVGIDLGTTNSAVAFVDLKSRRPGRPALEPFPIPQLVAAGEIGARQLLPSFLYRPGQHDLPAGATALPWNAAATDPVGEFAREHGAKIPGRLVSSAKSWLCHPGVDRTAALLPWGAPPDVPRLSPLEVSSRYLKHIVDAWNHGRAKSDDERLENLPVVLTVPASFDDVARVLTVEAAKAAGLTNLTLLEEPQAAFYCWKHVADEATLTLIRPGMTCLVVDVGGGTTDFSLIAAAEEHGELVFVRQAVGDHLLLGGDNMDLALARLVEGRLPAGKLDAVQFAALVQSCRRVKERLLGPNPPGEQMVTVVGRGRSVVGGTITTPLTLEDVARTIGEGFFPDVQPGDGPQSARGGLHEMGLPYVQDAGVTRHLAAFLSRHLPPGAAPDAILFNGGVFTPRSLRDRLVAAIAPWYRGRSAPVILATPSLDLAVASGAAAFAWIRRTGGRVIGGGTARSYYLEVGAGGDDARPTVLCVVPRRMVEGEEVRLAKPELELALGEPVSFPLYSSTARDDRPGDVITVAPEQLRRMPPLTTLLRAGKRSAGEKKTVPVTLAAKTTAIGTLELACVAVDGGTRWRLEFSTRDAVDEDEDADADVAEAPTEVFPESAVAPAAALIERTFAGEPPAPNELTRALESALETSRESWPTALCRRLWDSLCESAESRRRTPAHLARWYNLVGFCLRPGTGYPLDRHRVESLWKLLHAPKAGQAAPPEPTGADAWILWRRVAAGLNTSLQKTLFDRLRPTLLGKAGVRPGANELAEMWRAAASLERLDPKLKSALGEELLKQLRRPPAPTYAFWSLGRLGARSLLYGPMNAVVHPDTASLWLDKILPFQPENQSERLAWAFCLAELARRTGQRALDVDESHRSSVVAAIRSVDAPAAWASMVVDVSPRSAAERAQAFGESLPVGLRLKG